MAEAKIVWRRNARRKKRAAATTSSSSRSRTRSRLGGLIDASPRNSVGGKQFPSREKEKGGRQCACPGSAPKTTKEGDCSAETTNAGQEGVTGDQTFKHCVIIAPIPTNVEAAFLRPREGDRASKWGRGMLILQGSYPGMAVLADRPRGAPHPRGGFLKLRVTKESTFAGTNIAGVNVTNVSQAPCRAAPSSYPCCRSRAAGRVVSQAGASVQHPNRVQERRTASFLRAESVPPSCTQTD